MDYQGLIGTIAGAAHDTNMNIGNWLSQAVTNKRNREFARDMAGYQNEVNRANWQAENAYNTPAMQLSRMKAAGINPALAMNNGQSLELAGSNMQAAAQVNASPQVAPQFSGNPALVAAQVDLLQAQASKTRSESKEVDARTVFQELQNNAEKLIQEYTPYYYADDGTRIDLPTQNLRVDAQRLEVELNRQGVQLNNASMNDIMFNWMVLTGAGYQGSDNFNVFATPEDSWNFYRNLKDNPYYQIADKNLKGDRRLQQLSIDVAELDFEARKAEKAGSVAFERFIENNKDNPLVQILLIFRGLLQTSALPGAMSGFPRIGINRVTSNHDHIHYHKR